MTAPPGPPARAPEDRAWLERCRAGDRAALERLYRENVGLVGRVVAGIVGRDRSRVEDVVHDVFVKVFEGVARFEGRSRLTTWIRRIAVNAALDARRARQEVALEEPEAVPASGRPVGGRLEEAEASAALGRAVDGLGEPLRTCLLLREVEGLGYREIAETLEVEIGTVMSRLHRARQRVRAHLKKEGILPP